MKLSALSLPLSRFLRARITSAFAAFLISHADAQNTFRTWMNVESPTTATLTDVAYGNGLWLATGETVVTSADGLTWREIVDPKGLPAEKESWGELRYVHDRFILHGAWKQSQDGTNWTDFPVPEGRTALSVGYANGKWVCVGGGGLFASATTPGDWTIHSVGLTSDPIQHLVYLNDTWHAFSHLSYGMRAFNSSDGENWSFQAVAMDQWFSSLEPGEIRKPDGSVESVAVGTTNTQTMVIVRNSRGLATLESRTRSTYGSLIFRGSGEIGSPNGVRREWVNIHSWNGEPVGPYVYTLSTTEETPRIENANTTNDLHDAATGPDAMIAVGEGGVIRRYGTRQSDAPPILAADIQNSVEISWQGNAGASYMIQESLDGQTWTNALPTPLPGKTSLMKWNTPTSAQPRRLFRVQQF